MRVTSELLNLPVVVSSSSGSQQDQVETSLQERHGGGLLHAGGALVVLQPGQKVVPCVNSNRTGQILQRLLHVSNGDIERGLVSILPCFMGDITADNATTATAIAIKILWTEGGWARDTRAPAAPARSSTIRTKRGEPAVTTTAAGSSSAAVRGVQAPVFKVTGRGATARETGTSVG